MYSEATVWACIFANDVYVCVNTHLTNKHVYTAAHTHPHVRAHSRTHTQTKTSASKNVTLTVTRRIWRVVAKKWTCPSWPCVCRWQWALLARLHARTRPCRGPVYMCICQMLVTMDSCACVSTKFYFKHTHWRLYALHSPLHSRSIHHYIIIWFTYIHSSCYMHMCHHHTSAEATTQKLIPFTYNHNLCICVNIPAHRFLKQQHNHLSRLLRLLWCVQCTTDGSH